MVLAKDINIAGNAYASICDAEDASRRPIGVDVMRDAQTHASVPCPHRGVVPHYVASFKRNESDQAAYIASITGIYILRTELSLNLGTVACMPPKAEHTLKWSTRQTVTSPTAAFVSRWCSTRRSCFGSVGSAALPSPSCIAAMKI